MYYCVIDESGNVVNIIVWDGVPPYNPGAGLIIIQSDTAGIGDIYDPLTNTFSKPDPEIEDKQEA